MLLTRRFLRRSALALLGICPASCLGQTAPQFTQPQVELTGGRVAGFVAGVFQPSGSQTDMLYVNAATVSGGSSQVLAGLLLSNGRGAFYNLNENQLVFQNASSAVAAVADFDGDGFPDYAFALSPTIPGANTLCVYYGSGQPVPASSYSPLSQKSGCLALPQQGNLPPQFTYMAATPFRTGTAPQLLVEDGANNLLYVLANNGNDASNGVLQGFAVRSVIALPAADGAGPIYAADLNGDSATDFIVNGQTGLSATVYLGNGDGTFRAQPPLHFDRNVHSMLLNAIDGGTHPDLVVEGDGGTIEIFHGNGDGTFATTSEGGTAAGANGFSGSGGHLAAIAKLGADATPDILTATPIGLSVLRAQGNSLNYGLKAIYNAGPGRTSFALADFNGDGYLDLAVDSAEGIAILFGDSNGDAGFQTSQAFAAGQPALGAVVAPFTASGHLDVAVATGTTQAQVLPGNGTGAFTALPAPTNTAPSPNPTLWSNLLSADFNGDGIPDLLYSLTGLPLPTPGASAGTGLYLQYGNGDGTFEPPIAILSQLVGAPSNNNFYGESAVGDFNGDGLPDIANIDTLYYDTLQSQAGGGGLRVGLNILEDAGTNDAQDLDSFSQVAAGAFSGTRTTALDLLFQDDANITPYVNDGHGNFTARQALAGVPSDATLYGATVLLHDMDGDGNGDIVIPYHNLAADPANPSAATQNQLYVWYGNGDGTFGQPVVATLSRNFYLAAVADMNGDGLPDIVVSDGSLVGILYNRGNRTFGTVQNGVTYAQHFLAGQGINSLTLADVNGDGALDLVVANGGATISNAIALGGLAPGTNALSLTANPDVNTGGITVLLNDIKTRPVTGTLAASPEPSSYGTAFTLTAVLVPSAGVALPTGTVSFSVAGTPVGQAIVVVPGTSAQCGAGPACAVASYTVPAGNTYTGEPTIGAQYSGDAANSQLTLNGVHLIQGVATTTSLNLCVGPTAACPTNGLVTPPYMANLTMYYGQTYNGSTQVISSDGSALTGNILFNDTYNGVTTTLCVLPASSAGYSCPPSVGTTFTPGVHVFQAVYQGDAGHFGSSSPTVTIDMVPDVIVAASLLPSLPVTSTLCPPNTPPLSAPLTATSIFGQAVTYTITLYSNFSAPTGSVYLLDSFGGPIPPTGSPVLPTAANTLAIVPLTPVAGFPSLSSGTVTISTLAYGTHPLSLYYAGNADFGLYAPPEDPPGYACALPPYDPALLQQVLPTPTLTALTSVPNPSIYGQAVTFTATSTTTTGVPIPSGTVTFSDGTTPLGTTAIGAGGVATFTTSTLAVGSHTITATTNNTTNNTPSTSTGLVQVVNPSNTPGSSFFSLTVTPSPVTVAVGNGAALTVTVVALNGFTQAVKLTCGNLPGEATCSFASPAIAPGGGQTQLLLTTMAPHACGAAQPYFYSTASLGGLPLGLPVLAGVAAFLLPFGSGKRRCPWLRGLIAFAAAALALQATGCGNCTDLGTRPATYTLTVTGTSADSSVTQTVPVVLRVTL